MFLNSWSIALSLLSSAVLFFAAVSGKTAWRVLRSWNPASDDREQIALESEIWLTSTLIEYTLAFQIIGLILLVLAADSFCEVIVGAMCATGSLLANAYGVPALMVKLVGLFFYGFWIVLHRLDISAETYPLVRIKYLYFLVLLPLLGGDVLLQSLYLANLQPDIITSCCGVIFAEGGDGGMNLLAGFDGPRLLFLFYGLALLLAMGGGGLRRRARRWGALVYAGGWLFFLLIAIVAVTVVFSSYIYAMPYHHCPFCILKPEYRSIGYALYGTLLPAAFMGMSVGLVQPLRRWAELRPAIERMEKAFLTGSLLLLAAFVCLASYHLVLYRLTGGE
ncbi:MAG: hypothetical protein AB1568_00755 [Thermodesulfobacteriota bacterium]